MHFFRTDSLAKSRHHISPADLTGIFDAMITPAAGFPKHSRLNELFLRKRWPWHLLFWFGYILFRTWLYYITVTYYPPVFLEYMLLSEIFFVGVTYLTIRLYKLFFEKKKYVFYFSTGTILWILYLYCRTIFQFYYLRNAPGFKGNMPDVLLNNITVILVCFLFITACKYFKDGYIKQQFESEKKEQQLIAENNNLKSQIAPHFLFNTLNNLYGLAVERSEKLPGLMLQLSDLLRHSLYETQKPLVSLNEEIKVLRSYVELERVRLEDDLELVFDNQVPPTTNHQIAPLILIVFMENAFKHSKSVRSGPVNILVKATVKGKRFTFSIRNNCNSEIEHSPHGIGLSNVKRRLEVLYPGDKHELTISRDEGFYQVHLVLELSSET